MGNNKGQCSTLDSGRSIVDEIMSEAGDLNGEMNGWGCNKATNGNCDAWNNAPSPTPTPVRYYIASRAAPYQCCRSNVDADPTTCDSASGIDNVKDCIKAICGKDNIYWGQCDAPKLGMWAGA